MLDVLQKRFEEASRSYCEANDLERDQDWFMLKLQEEVGELSQAWNKLCGRGRRRGKTDNELFRDFEDEAADVLGHILLISEASGMDLRSAIQRKWRFDPQNIDQ